MFASFPGFIPGYQAARKLLPASSDFPNFVPRDAKHEYLKPLTKEERKRFGLEANDEGQVSDPAKKPKPTPVAPRFRYKAKADVNVQAKVEPKSHPETPPK
jgi:hypothetical protein